MQTIVCFGRRRSARDLISGITPDKQLEKSDLVKYDLNKQNPYPVEIVKENSNIQQIPL
jgi:hypothetical protein